MTRRRYRKAVQTVQPTIRPKLRGRELKPPSAQKVKAISDALVFGVLATLIVVVLRSLISATWPLVFAPLIGLGTAGLVIAIYAVAARSARRDVPHHPIESASDHGKLPPPPVLAPAEPVTIVPAAAPPAQYQHQREVADWHFFLREAYSNRETTRRFWVGRKLPSGNSMNRSQWKEYTERLRSAGLASRLHRNARLELLGDYRQALDVFREML